MVVALKHHVHIQILQNRDNLGLEAALVLNVAVMGMAGHGKEGVVEHDDLPLDVRILGGRNGCLHKGFMSVRRLNIAVEHHKQRVVIDKVVVAACGSLSVLGRLVGYIEVLAVGIGAGVVVANGGGHGQAGQDAVVQITVVLALVGGAVDLIARRQQEGNIGELGIGVNNVQGVVPTLNITCSAASADLGVAHESEGEGSAIIGGEVIAFAGVARIAELIVIGLTGSQSGDSGLAAILAVVGDRGGCLDGLCPGHVGIVRHKQLRPCERRVPGEVHLALIRAHGQADVVLVAHLLIGQGQVGEVEPDVGAGRTALMQLHSEGIFSSMQDTQVEHFKGDRLGRTLVGATILEVGRNIAIIKTSHPPAVDIYGGRIVILERTLQLGHSLQRGHVKGGAEEVDRGIGGFVAAI